MNTIKDCPAEGDYVLEVGAFSLERVGALMEAVGEEGYVHAIDPQFVEYDITPDRNAAMWPIALGSARGIVNMSLPGDGRPEGSGPFSNLRIGAEPGLKVECDTIDNIAAKWKRLDFLAIDVNGFEPFVLMGGRNTIMRLRPAIRVRIDGDKLDFYGFAPVNIVTFLQILHYKAYPRPRKVKDDEPHDLVCEPLPL